MTMTPCPAGEWTDIPDTGGDMLLSTANGGFWVCTDGTNPIPVNGCYSLGATESMVIAAGTAVSVYPASILGCTATSQVA